MTTKGDVKEQLAGLRDVFADHRLTVLVESDKASVYRLARPGTINMSVVLADLPTGLFLSGDACYGSQNEVFARYKSLRWFRGMASPECNGWDYLAGKFGLVQRHDFGSVKPAAVRGIRVIPPPAQNAIFQFCPFRENLASHVDALEDLDYESSAQCYRAAVDAGLYPDGAIADEYDASAVATLFAISEAFVREEKANTTDEPSSVGRRVAWCGICRDNRADTVDGQPLTYMGRFVCTVCHGALQEANADNPPTKREMNF